VLRKHKGLQPHKLTVSIHIVLFVIFMNFSDGMYDEERGSSTWEPGDPNTTMPPSVGLFTRLLRTMAFWQDTEMPSAHCWNALEPAGPMSLFWMVMLLQENAPLREYGQLKLPS
jgi:hypothetical protein